MASSHRVAPFVPTFLRSIPLAEAALAFAAAGAADLREVKRSC